MIYLHYTGDRNLWDDGYLKKKQKQDYLEGFGFPKPKVGEEVMFFFLLLCECITRIMVCSKIGNLKRQSALWHKLDCFLVGGLLVTQSTTHSEQQRHSQQSAKMLKCHSWLKLATTAATVLKEIFIVTVSSLNCHAPHYTSLQYISIGPFFSPPSIIWHFLTRLLTNTGSECSTTLNRTLLV